MLPPGFAVRGADFYGRAFINKQMARQRKKLDFGGCSAAFSET
jgi:hypothetical protein